MTSQFDLAVSRVRDGISANELAQSLVDLMENDEVIATLHGDMPFWECIHEADHGGYNIHPYIAGENNRLGIPGIRFADGPRGIVVGSATAFPVALARGSTWDPEFESTVASAIGREARARGANLYAGICVNLIRHPGWGRSQESYGEDPVHVGAMALGAVEGVQAHVMACVKHFALNSIEKARHRVDVQCDIATLHELYLPQFKQLVDAGVASVMSAYNSVNGSWAGQSSELLSEILRQEWKFGGFVMSDFFLGFRDSVAALTAGMDLEMPCAQQHPRALLEALLSGTLSRAELDVSAVRIVRAQLENAAFRDAPDVSYLQQDLLHRDLARESAVRSMVLLKNESVDQAPVLPLDATSLREILVLGALADVPVTGDHGSSDVRAPYVVTLLEGLRAELPHVLIHHESHDAERARVLAQSADVVISFLAYSDSDQGEHYDIHQDGLLESLAPEPSGAYEIQLRSEVRARMASVLDQVRNPDNAHHPTSDRTSLELPAADVALMEAALAVNPRVVAVIQTGNAVVMPWAESVPAILLQWFAGMEGGSATAAILLGRSVPTGRLPLTFPAAGNVQPRFDPDSDTAAYDRWFGYRLLDREGQRPAFPLGFGLTYGRLERGPVVVEPGETAGTWTVRTSVRNLGSTATADVVQVYGGPTVTDDSRPSSVLLGFSRVCIEPGASVDVSVWVDAAPLSAWNGEQLVLPQCPIAAQVGRWQGDPNATRVTLS